MPHRPLRTAVVLPFALAVVLSAVATLGPAPPAGAATTCTQDWRPADPPVYLTASGTPAAPPAPMPPVPGPGYRAFHVFCGGHYVNSVWLAPVIGEITGSRAAWELVTGAVYPTVRPAVNPTRGITGLASWFWAERTDDPVHMLPGNGPGLDLELRIETVRWRFGDGNPGTVSGFGAAYPTPSPVRHVFERKGTYTVEAQVVVVGHLRFEELDYDLPPGGHTVRLRHDVAEVRNLLHAR